MSPKKSPDEKPPPSMALRRYDELMELQQKKTDKRTTTSAVISLADAIADAELRVREALEDAGILEHRAILTGRIEDADAYSESLVILDAAYAELWARETLGRRLRVEDVNEERDRVIEEAQEEDSRFPREQPRPLEARMEFRRKLLALDPPTEASVQLMGLREVGPVAKDMAIDSDADLALRRRLSQVAKASEGPTTVKVLRRPAKKAKRLGKK